MKLETCHVKQSQRSYGHLGTLFKMADMAMLFFPSLVLLDLATCTNKFGNLTLEEEFVCHIEEGRIDCRN